VVLPPDNPEDVTGLPDDVALAHAFVNTLDLRTFRVHGRRMQRSDAWPGPRALEEWLRGHRLLTGAGPATTVDLDRARHLRSILRDSTRQSPSASPVPEEKVATLTAFPLLVSVRPGTGGHLTPPGGGVGAALSHVLIIAVELTARGMWARLRMCPAPDCQWIFYDQSRPGRGRWCSPDLCGNRMKLRAHRQRQETHHGQLEAAP
jgi:predicted RNA-binding Zn ribbon-like protein